MLERSERAGTPDAVNSDEMGHTRMAAATIADTTDFSGSWDVGISIIRLRGLGSAWLADTQTFARRTPFSEDSYRQTIRVTGEKLTQEPDTIVGELTGRLTRALGSAPPIPF